MRSRGASEALVILYCLPPPLLPAGCPLAVAARLPPAAWHPDPLWLPARPGCSPMLEESLCCGIDAEWPPEETTQEAQRGGPPRATLVQLALWLPPGSSRMPGLGDADGCKPGASSRGSSDSSSSGSGNCCALLLDMLGLPPAQTRQALQQLFRCGTTRCPQPAPVPPARMPAGVHAGWLAASSCHRPIAAAH